jgi:hypothetical protein
MSMGTWALAAYGPLMGVAAVSEVMPAWLRRTLPGRIIDVAARPAGLAAAAIAPAVASYTAVLLSDTATPTWHEAGRDLPFVFVGSAAAAAGGAALALTPTAESGPARRLAVGGAALDLLAGRVMEARAGIAAEPLRQGRAKKLMDAARALTATGALVAGFGRRSRVASAVGGAALVAALLHGNALLGAVYGVAIVATATLGALVAGGGLGRYIVDGLARQEAERLFVGALLVALLAIATELAFSLGERFAVPPGIREHWATPRTGPAPRTG